MINRENWRNARVIITYSTFLVLSFLLLGCAPKNVVQLEHEGLIQAEQIASRIGRIRSPQTDSYLSYLERRLHESIPAPRQHSYEFVLLDSTERIAFSPGAGKILISRGMILSLRSEAELAFVLAHEMGHQELGHTLSTDHSYLRDLELASDRFAIGLIAIAGYDPRVTSYALEHAYQNKWAAASGNDTHPTLRERVRAAESFIANSKWTPPGTVNRRGYKKFWKLLRG